MHGVVRRLEEVIYKTLSQHHLSGFWYLCLFEFLHLHVEMHKKWSVFMQT